MSVKSLNSNMKRPSHSDFYFNIQRVFAFKNYMQDYVATISGAQSVTEIYSIKRN